MTDQATEIAALKNRVAALEALTTALMIKVLPEIQVGGEPVVQFFEAVTGPSMGGKLPVEVQEELKNLFLHWHRYSATSA